MQWILGLALAAALFVILKQWGRLSAEKRKAATWKIVLLVGGILLLFMVLTGRVHLLTAAVAALVPLLRKVPQLLRFVPALSRLFASNDSEPGAGASGNGQQHAGRAGSGDMSEAEACDVLGVDVACSREDVITAHRRLIQKLHPDRGGNDYLAAKINEAKSVLLRNRS